MKNVWKNMSSWLKGGIILGVLGYPIILLITFLSLIINPSSLSLSTSVNTIAYLSFLKNLSGINLMHNDMWWGLTPTTPGQIVIVLSWLILFFIVGALIGWVIGKIKNK